MTKNTYQIGNIIRLQGTFRDANGALANATITLRVKLPDGTITAYTTATGVLNPSTGIYTYDLNDLTHGEYYYRWEAAGAFIAAEERNFRVVVSNILTT